MEFMEILKKIKNKNKNKKKKEEEVALRTEQKWLFDTQATKLNITKTRSSPTTC